MLLEVEVEAFAHGGVAEEFVELFDEGGAFAVGDAVEKILSLIGVCDSRADGMSAAQLVLLDSKELVSLEGEPGASVELRALFDSDHGQKAHKSRKGLVKPQIIPPLHSHQISKPHMSQLMKHGRRKLQILLQSTRLPPIHILFVKSDASNILHSAAVVLGRKDHIILAEGVGRPEELGVEADAGDGESEHHLFIHISQNRLPSVNPHRRHILYLTLMITVLSRHNRIQISGDRI